MNGAAAKALLNGSLKIRSLFAILVIQVNALKVKLKSNYFSVACLLLRMHKIFNPNDLAFLFCHRSEKIATSMNYLQLIFKDTPSVHQTNYLPATGVGEEKTTTYRSD